MSQQPRRVVQRYFSALERGDGAAVCATMTARGREQVVRPLHVFGEHSSRRPSCARLMDLYGKSLREDHAALAELLGTQLGAARIKGRRATVGVTRLEGEREVLPLVATAAGWRINGPEAPAGGAAEG